MTIRFTVGTHNLHDQTGTPTLFADLIVFCEAIPAKITNLVSGSVYRAVVCRQQPDLVVVYNTRIFRRQRLARLRYVKYVDGIPKVTPNRGTFTIPLIHRATGRKIRVNAEHRINAAFPPYVRGEAQFRLVAWNKHTGATLATMRRHLMAGLLTIGAGDVNTPHGVRGYPGFHEIGDHFDRIGSNAELTHLEVLSRMGSDHARIRATLTER